MKINHIVIAAVLLVASAGVAAPPAPPATTPSSPTVTKAKLLVSFKTGKKAAVKRAIAAAGGTISYENDDVETLAVALPESAIDALADRADVAYVEEDAERHIMADAFPWGIEAVQARQIWDADRDGNLDPGAPKGNGKTVCIIDTGLMRGHPDLAGVDVKGGVSLVADGPWDEDFHGHGTFIAGIIAAQRNGVGTVGLAPMASLYIVRALNNEGTTSSSVLIQAAEACVAAGSDIINMSLGGPFASRSEDRYYSRLLTKKNVLVIAAAGNDGNQAHQYPASYDAVISVAAVEPNLEHASFSQVTEEVELCAPGTEIFAAFPRQETFSVTVNGGAPIRGIPIDGLFQEGVASGRLEWGGDCREPGNFAGAIAICNFGDYWGTDLVMNNMQASGAAGVILLNGNGAGYFNDIPYPLVTVALQRLPGKDLVHAALTETAEVQRTVVDAAGYRIWQGTSFATPHVVGVAALIWSKYPRKSAVALRAAMDATARDLGPAGRDPYFGYGMVQAKAAMDYLGSH